MFKKTNEQPQDVLENIKQRHLVAKQVSDELQNKTINKSSMLVASALSGAFGVGMTTSLSEFASLGYKFGDKEIVKNYLLTHAQSLDMLRLELGTEDVDYISSYVLGNDSSAKQLFSQSGLADFFAQAHNGAMLDGVVGGVVYASLPIVAYYF